VFDPPSSVRLVLFVGAICLPLTAGACGGGGGEAALTTRSVTAEQDASSRCTDVPRALVTTIATRLPAHETLLNAQAVKSRDLKRVWFISAEIDGPGLKGIGDIGTWAKVGPLSADGWPILSVDSVFAQQLSGWPRSDTTYVDATMDDAGAQESHDCVRSG
jgi:hypothetical protein